MTTEQRNEILEGLDRLSEQFMAPEIRHDEWLLVDGMNGIEIIPSNLVAWRPDPETDYETVPAEISDYVMTQHCTDITCKTGWSARLSASGYMDCTDWIGVFPTREQAESYLVEMYDDGASDASDE